MTFNPVAIEQLSGTPADREEIQRQAKWILALLEDGATVETMVALELAKRYLGEKYGFPEVIVRLAVLGEEPEDGHPTSPPV